MKTIGIHHTYILVFHCDLGNFLGRGYQFYPCLPLPHPNSLGRVLCHFFQPSLRTCSQCLIWKLPLPSATLRSRQIFRLVEMAQSPLEACWCTHQFLGVLSVQGRQHDGYMQAQLFVEGTTGEQVQHVCCNNRLIAVETHLQVLNSFILLFETWEKLQCLLQNITYASEDKMQ